MAKQKILVTGANGQLGREIRELSSAFTQYEFIFFSHEELNIGDPKESRAVLTRYRPSFVINAAAYTAVDKAEEDREIAFLVNATAVGELAKATNDHSIPLIHISTDYVFNGSSEHPYQEDEPMDPQSVYGSSKAAGEMLALEAGGEVMIIRTSWLYSSYGKNFVKTMVGMMKEGKDIRVVNDQYGSPTYAADLAEAILQILATGKWKSGIYHYCNAGVISWFELATAIKELSLSESKLKPITTEEYPTAAKRPAYSALDTRKVEQTFGIGIKGWKESLRRCIEKMHEPL